MATVVPVDAFTRDWYPGFTPELIGAPYIVDGFGPFTKKDAESFWFLDFHWPRGMTPLGACIWTADGYCWGTQHAAETLPLPPGHGLTARFAGTHLYGSALPETDAWQIGARAKRFARNLAAFLQNYHQIWENARDELEDTWRYFRGVNFGAASHAELGMLLRQARYYHKRSLEIHFDVMYPLLANFLGFYGACIEMGINPAEVGKFLQGEDTKIMETDRELSKLAGKARRAGMAETFASNEPGRLRQALSAHGGAASRWLTDFDDFLQIYGFRVEGTTDPALPSWMEDNTVPLGMIKTFLQKPEDHDFEAAQRKALAERDAAIDAARAGLTREEQTVFDGGLASNRAANFPWWQDDHNYYIDLRVMLPLRWTCHELARRVAADAQDDLLYLFWPELIRVAHREASYDEFRGLVEARKQYFDHWRALRPTMPKVLGTVPESVDDPVLIEIFGINPESIKAVLRPDVVTAGMLTGVPASKGVARGIARVLQSSDQLHRLEPGNVLVCESTSPNWTPAFGKIVAAVCDSGGMCSHAAIVGREYGVPTVTAVGVATVAISDGDEVEVDGTRGTVTIITRAGSAVPADASPTEAAAV